MTHRFMISVAALALAAGTGMANAQGTMGRGDAGSAGAQPMQQNAQPSGGAADRGGGTTGKQDKGTVGQAGGAGMKSGTGAEERSSGAMKDDRSSTMNKNPTAEDKAGAARGQRTDEHAQGGQDRSRSGTDRNNAENRPGTGTNMNAQGRNGSSTTVGQAGAGAKLSTEQRTQITSVIREERVAPVTNVNFSVSVGTRVPREGIELHALPSRIATIYPEWRSYRYVLIRDEIVIIDPDTYEIVAVLNT